MMPYTDEEMDWVSQSPCSREHETVGQTGLSNDQKARRLADWQASVWTTPEAWEPKGPKA